MNPVRRYISQASRLIKVSQEEQELRLAKCGECDWARLNATGYCSQCKKPFHKRIQYDSELVCKCGGGIKVIKDFAQCGHCGCPLASRTAFKQASCPIGKWK